MKRLVIFLVAVFVLVVVCPPAEVFGVRLQGGQYSVYFGEQVVFIADTPCGEGDYKWSLQGAGTLQPEPGYPSVAVYTAPKDGTGLSCSSNPTVRVEETDCADSRAERFMYIINWPGGTAYAGLEVRGDCLYVVGYDCKMNRRPSYPEDVCGNIYGGPGDVACCEPTSDCYDWTVVGGCGRYVSCSIIPYRISVCEQCEGPDCNSDKPQPCAACPSCTPENLVAFAGGFCATLPYGGVKDLRGFYGQLGPECGCTPPNPPDNCIAGFTVNGNSLNPAAGGLVTFSGTAGGPWTLTVGGGQIGSGGAGPISASWSGKADGKFLEPGTYQATVTVTGGCSGNNTASTPVEITSDAEDPCLNQ
jgi:hypothetical protein